MCSSWLVELEEVHADRWGQAEWSVARITKQEEEELEPGDEEQAWFVVRMIHRGLYLHTFSLFL